jgi:hypothetical protein
MIRKGGNHEMAAGSTWGRTPLAEPIRTFPGQLATAGFDSGLGYAAQPSACRELP